VQPATQSTHSRGEGGFRTLIGDKPTGIEAQLQEDGQFEF
jgi:hypothetical protein